MLVKSLIPHVVGNVYRDRGDIYDAPASMIHLMPQYVTGLTAAEIEEHQRQQAGDVVDTAPAAPSVPPTPPTAEVTPARDMPDGPPPPVPTALKVQRVRKGA